MADSETGLYPLRFNSGVLLGNVVSFLEELRSHSRSVDAHFTIHVHQFGHTPLYAPMYMALESVIDAARRQLGGSEWIRMKYWSHESDKASQERVRAAGPWKLNGGAELHLGMSEVTDRLLIDKAVVKRLPLWGVALADNPRIAALRRLREEGEQAEFAEFRRFFAGKMSLLQPQNGDLTRDDEPLSVSLYEAGSTAHEVFLRYLRDNGQPSHLLKWLPVPNGFEREFELLFTNQVDVALTVQPWRALKLAREGGRNVELVYTHLGRPEPITSLYLAPDGEDKVQLWAAFLQILGAVVQENVGNLYDCRSEGLAYARRCFTDAAQRRVDDRGEPLPDHPDLSLESREDFLRAMQLLSDSRVYYYDSFAGSDDAAARQKGYALALNSRLHRYFDDVARRDPAYSCSMAAAFIQKTADWHLSRKLKSLKCVESEAVFARVATSFDVPFDRNSNLPQIRTLWNLRFPSSVLGAVYGQWQAANRPIAAEPWRAYFNDRGQRISKPTRSSDRQVDFAPWIHRDVLEKGLMHLNAQFIVHDNANRDANQLRLRDFRMDVDVLGRSSGVLNSTSEYYEGLSWIWLEYHRENAGEISRNAFFDDNEVGFALLSAWYVNIVAGPRPLVRPLFTREGHGTLNMRGRVPVLELDKPVERKILPTRESDMGASEAILVTFRVVGIESNPK